jgi:hypothetical protein
MLYDYFIAVPMSSVPKEEYDEFKANIVDLVADYREQTGGRIFCAAIDAEAANFDDPSEAYTSDIQGIADSKEMVVLWPKSVASGLLWEAGLMTGKGKPVTWLVRDNKDMPYMLRGIQKDPRDKMETKIVETWNDIRGHFGLPPKDAMNKPFLKVEELE